VRDWRWLAFVAAGTLLQKYPQTITRDLVALLKLAAAEETDPARKKEMVEVAQKCASQPSSISD
jgi:hypothetical protein